MLDAETIKALEHEILVKETYYTLVTEIDGKFHLAPRPNQPCIGGNHRKYKESHPDDCTRPQDRCPSDLMNHPGNCDDCDDLEVDDDGEVIPPYRFPNGRPAGAGYTHWFDPHHLPLFDYMTSSKSPWLKGFGHPDNILRVRKNGGLYGYILTTGDIDITVWINFLKHIEMMDIIADTFNAAKENGLSDRDALILTIFSNSGVSNFYNPEYLTESDTYHWDNRSSVRKFINQTPDDLTGGLWSDRYDYNRPQVQSIFRDEKAIPFVAEVNSIKKNTSQNIYKVVQQVIAKELGE